MGGSQGTQAGKEEQQAKAPARHSQHCLCARGSAPHLKVFEEKKRINTSYSNFIPILSNAHFLIYQGGFDFCFHLE